MMKRIDVKAVLEKADVTRRFLSARRPGAAARVEAPCE
jgi:hypothetical protein